MIKQKFYNLFSELTVTFWQSRKNLDSTMSNVAPAGSQTQNLVSKKCSKLGKTAV